MAADKTEHYRYIGVVPPNENPFTPLNGVAILNGCSDSLFVTLVHSIDVLRVAFKLIASSSLPQALVASRYGCGRIECEVEQMGEFLPIEAAASLPRHTLALRGIPTNVLLLSML
jgi:hypothetical protein